MYEMAEIGLNFASIGEKKQKNPERIFKGVRGGKCEFVRDVKEYA